MRGVSLPRFGLIFCADVYHVVVYLYFAALWENVIRWPQCVVCGAVAGDVDLVDPGPACASCYYVVGCETWLISFYLADYIYQPFAIYCVA